MSHDYHQGPEGAVLYDGCQECDERAIDPLKGLANLDASSYQVLRRRMLEVEFGMGHYLTGNEASLGRALHTIFVLEERYGQVSEETRVS